MPKTDLENKELDELIAYIVKHPTRVAALSIFNERMASTAEVAAVMGLEPSQIGHHIKDLVDSGFIKIIKSEQRRGAREHYYFSSLRLGTFSAEKWGRLSKKARRYFSGLIFQAMVAEGLAALRVGTFDSKKNRHLSWQTLSLDEEGWQELVKEKARSFEETEKIQARAYRRMAGSRREGVSFIAAALAFERARPGRAGQLRPIE